MIKGIAPYPSYFIANKFGVPSDYYTSAGMKGHPALDLLSPKAFKDQGDYVVAAVSAPVYKVFNKDNPDTTKYRCVFQIYECDGRVFEVSYGHLKNIYVAEGEYLEAGQTLGIEGNTGDVFTNGHAVSLAERAQGKGTHVHWQWREVKKVKQLTAGKQYLDNISITGQRQADLYKDKEGFYYEVLDYDNGYHGCVDPLNWIYHPTPSQWLTEIWPKVVYNIFKSYLK